MIGTAVRLVPRSNLSDTTRSLQPPRQHHHQPLESAIVHTTKLATLRLTRPIAVPLARRSVFLRPTLLTAPASRAVPGVRSRPLSSKTKMADHNVDASCIFCKIIKGDIPSFKLLDTSSCFAFLDIGPLSKGHALIIPKCASLLLMNLCGSLERGQSMHRSRCQAA